GGALQFLVQLPWILRLQRRLQFTGIRSADASTVVRNAGPAIMGRGVVQLSGWVDMVLASFLFDGAVAALGYAQTFYMLPVSLFGMSIAAAELPELSRGSGTDLEPLRRRVAAGLRQMAVFVIPSLVGYITLGDVIVGSLYERGEFDRSDTILVYLILAAYSIGLLASTATRLYSSAFYALRDTKTPAGIAVIRVITSGVIAATLMILLEPITVRGVTIGVGSAVTVLGNPVGAVGLAAGAGLGAWLEWLLLRRKLHARIGSTAAGSVLARLILAALVAAGVGRGVLLLLPELPGLVELVAALVPFGLVYFGVGSLLGVQEVRRLVGRVFRRRQQGSLPP